MATEQQLTLSNSEMICRSDDQVSVDLDGETVLLHTETGRYFTMNEVASAVWNLLVHPMSTADLLDGVKAEFDPPEAGDMSEDLLRFLTRLVTIGVLSRS